MSTNEGDGKTNTMTSTFELLKNGKLAAAVWANPVTKEIYPANRNSFGYNAEKFYNAFYDKYGKDLKANQGKANYKRWFYSAASMQSVGFQLVLRGENPLW